MFLVCQQNDCATNADVGIDDVAEKVAGDVTEHIGAEHRAYRDTAKTKAVVGQDCGGEESIVGAYQGHDEVAYQKIGLRHRHVMLFRWFGLDEIEDCWRTLHAEKSA